MWLIRQKITEHFFECLEAGDFPEAGAEGIFGCKMGDPVGDMVFAVWRTLHHHKRMTMDDVVDALAEGILPSRFRGWLDNLPAEKHSPHTLQLLADVKNLQKIPWDIPQIKKCCRSGRDVHVTVSVNSSMAPPKLLPTAGISAPAAPGRGRSSGIPAADDLLAKCGGDANVAAAALAQAAAQANATPAERDAASDLAQRLMAQGGPPKEPPQAGTGEGYSWTQQADELEVTIPVGDGVKKKDVRISFGAKELRMEAPKRIVLPLSGAIEADGCGWTISDGNVVVTLEKKDGKLWDKLLR